MTKRVCLPIQFQSELNYALRTIPAHQDFLDAIISLQRRFRLKRRLNTPIERNEDAAPHNHEESADQDDEHKRTEAATALQRWFRSKRTRPEKEPENIAPASQQLSSSIQRLEALVDDQDASRSDTNSSQPLDHNQSGEHTSHTENYTEISSVTKTSA